MCNYLFTIITVSYNSERTIEKTIQSVLAQTFRDFEYIVVDGKSTDSTIDILKHYEPLFKGNFRWISEADTGIYNAMNKGVMMANGKIIGIVNSDDWLETDALETLVNILKESENKDKILTGEMLFHYADGTTQHILTSYKRYEYYSKRYRMGLNHPATFVPKLIYDKIGLFDENFKLYADADFFIRCYEAGVGICFINKVLSNMCDGGVSNRMSKKVLSDSLLKIQKHAKSPYELWYLTIKTYFLCCLRMVIPNSYVKRYRYLLNIE
jgi:glycosyltransferase involved in cell wall biosynthesis